MIIGTLQLKPWYGNILGGIPMIVQGPYFKPDDEITCSFNDITVNCTRVDGDYAICRAPGLTYTSRAAVRLFLNGVKFQSDSYYYSCKLLTSSFYLYIK